MTSQRIAHQPVGKHRKHRNPDTPVLDQSQRVIGLAFGAGIVNQADAALRDARIKLILAVRQVLRNGLNLLGVSAPERM